MQELDLKTMKNYLVIGTDKDGNGVLVSGPTTTTSLLSQWLGMLMFHVMVQASSVAGKSSGYSVIEDEGVGDGHHQTDA